MWDEETPDSFRRKLLWWLGGLVVVAVAGFGIWYKFLFHPAAPAPAAAADAAPQATGASPFGVVRSGLIGFHECP